MPCRIGMATNPGQRCRYWESVHPNLRNWQILDRFKTKSASQQAETRLARQHGCVAAPGGDGPERANWLSTNSTTNRQFG